MQPSYADSTWLLFKGYEYGSDAYFSPATVFLAKGFDIFQLRHSLRNVWSFGYSAAWRHGIRDVFVRPRELIRRVGGWHRFAGLELYPGTWNVDEWHWFPNYTEHLLAGGLSMRMLDEWFRQHDVPLPRVFAMTVTYAASIMNEVTEQGRYLYPSAGGVADLLIFDTGAILLFHWKQPTEFFARTLQAADWQNQAAFTFPNHQLQNNGQYFTLKVPIGLKRTRLFIRGGIGAQVGLSRLLDDGERHLSAGFGGDTRLRMVDASGLETVTFAPSGGVYYDRNNSLLWSVTSSPAENLVTVNVYPGVLRGMRHLGVWGVYTREHQIRLGVVHRHALGLGIGVGR